MSIIYITTVSYLALCSPFWISSVGAWVVEGAVLLFFFSPPPKKNVQRSLVFASVLRV